MKQVRSCFAVGLLLAVLFFPRTVEAVPMDRRASEDRPVHVVQPGENLFRISLRYGTTVDALMTANGLTSPHTVYAGQRLVIPGASGTSDSSESPGTSGSVHTVQRGETLSRIARRYGITLDALTRANALSSPHNIYVGQRLVIPGAQVAASSAGSNLAMKESSPATSNTYVVRAGDTLSSIAQRFGTRTASLAQLNGIVNPSAIYPGQVLRLSAGAAPTSTGGAKSIVIDLSEQHLYAYQGNQLVYSFVASSGAAPSYTRAGEFRVQSKVLNAYGSTWNIWMPYWLGIYWAGSTENGIHALPILSNGQTLWAGLLGRPVSYGCIVLGTEEARMLYHWADIGTPVSVRY